MESKPKIDLATIIRTVLLFLALINTSLQLMGYTVLPFTPQEVETVITIIFNVTVGLVAWWKDNDIRKSTILKKKRIVG